MFFGAESILGSQCYIFTLGEYFAESSIDLESESRKVLLCLTKETTWKDRFCGWYDTGLSPKGKEQTQEYAQRIKKSGIKLNYAFNSPLIRSQETLSIILNEIEQPDVQIETNWNLNARHLGALTGLNIDETIAHYSYEQVDHWTNYYTVLPPSMTTKHKYYLSIINKFNDIGEEVPAAESFQMVQNRVNRYWTDNVVPCLEDKDTNILIVCHDSTLLTISKFLEKTVVYSSTLNINVKPPFYYDVDISGKPLNKIPL